MLTAETTATPAKLRVDLNRKRIEIVDGDRLDAWRVDQVRRASTAYGRSWMVIFDDAAAAVGRAKMSPASTAVMWWAIGHLDPREWQLIDQSHLAAMLGYDRTAIGRALSDLTKRGILIREGRGYRTSIWLGWRGTAAAYQKERRKRGGEIVAARLWHAENAVPGRDAHPLKPWRHL